MPNYKITGADLMEYGPVSAEQIRQWIAERRVNAEPKLQTEGAAECTYHYRHRRLQGLFRQMKTWGAHHNCDFGARGRSNSEKHMKHLGLALILVFTLVACSPQQDRDAKNEPIYIDKAQVDVVESDLFVDFARPGISNRYFFLTNTAPADEDARWKRVQTLHDRTVQFTDGREILGTGKVESVLQGGPGTKQGLKVVFPSPEALEDLERKLGFELRYKLAERCITNMTRIVTAARAWAHTHDEIFPSDFLSMKEEIGSPTLLVCPLDLHILDKQVWGWSQLNTNHLTYQIVSPGAPANSSTQTYLRCPIHGLAAYADGSVRKPDVK